MFALGCGIDEFVSSPDDSAVIDATPTSLGEVTVTLAYPGYEIFIDTVPVIETYGMLTGTVTDAASGDSLSGALVSVYVAGSDTSTATPVFEITTGAAGDYSAPDSLTVGPYDVYAVKFGYLDFTGLKSVMWGANTYDFAMTPAPSGVITGTITQDGTGIGLTANIQVYRSDDMSLMTETTSDSLLGGAFTTDPLPYFTYVLRISSYHHITQINYLTVDEATEYIDYELFPTIGNILVIDDMDAKVVPDIKYGADGELISTTEHLLPDEGDLSGRAKSAATIAQDIIDLGYDAVTETAAETDPLTWTDYDMIVWSSGDDTSPVSVESYRYNLNQYVAGGGKLLIEGGEIGYDAASYPGYANFADTTLHVTTWHHDSSGDLTLAMPAHPVATSPNPLPATLAIGYVGYGDHDALTPHAGVEMVYDWSSYPGQGGLLVYYETPGDATAQIIFYSFCYTSMTDTDTRADMLQNTIEHLIGVDPAAGVDITKPETPAEIFLSRARPNPFTAEARLQFGLSTNANVHVAVYNVLGQEVAVLADGMHPAGYYDVSWNGRGKDGKSVASGIYFCRLKTGDFMTTQRMVLMK
jgi:hypothetical protein